MMLFVTVLCLFPIAVLGTNGVCDGDDIDARYEIAHMANAYHAVQPSGCRDWMTYDVDDYGFCVQEGCASGADTIAYRDGVCYSWICGSHFAVTKEPNGWLIMRTKGSMVRLNDGTSSMSGVVELYSMLHGAWGVVCDPTVDGMDTWPIRVCGQLGYGAPKNVTSVRNTAISSIRLEEGDKPWNGYAQVWKDGEWGFVCADEFDAGGWPSFFCQELGYSGADEAHKRGESSSGRMSVMNPSCAGATKFTQCLSIPVCVHDSDVFITCSSPDSANVVQNKVTLQSSDLTPASTADLAADGDDNNDFNAGSCSSTQQEENPWWAVELGAVYTITSVAITNRGDCCGEELSDFVIGATTKNPAEHPPVPGEYAVCWTQEGSVPQGSTMTVECTEQVSGDYLIVQIPGGNKTLALCEVKLFIGEFVAVKEPQCPAFENGDVLQDCDESNSPCTADDAVFIECHLPPKRVRLADGMTEQDGIVEFFTEAGEWGTVCDPDTDLGDWPDVVCSQLGFGSAIDRALVPNAKSGPIGLQDPGDCNPADIGQLQQCPVSGNSCDHSTDVFIVCGASIRLQEGDKPWNGYAQVWKNGAWGFVCDEQFPAAGDWSAFFCRELGYSGADEAHKRGESSSGRMSVMNPSCAGATKFTQCLSKPVCGHDSDVFITCSSPDTDARLSGGDTPYQGRAEYNEGAWGTVCATNPDINGWPSVLCKELGYGPAVSATNLPSDSTDAITLMEPSCTTDDARNLGECTMLGTGCDHSNDVWIVCDTFAKSVKVVMLFDVSGSLSPKQTGSLLPQETNFLQTFFAHTSTSSFTYNYKLSLTVLPFAMGVINADKWELNYADYVSEASLQDAEQTGIEAFVAKIINTEPAGLTNLGKSLKEVDDAYNVDEDTVIIVVSDFLNMERDPDPLPIVSDLSSRGAHVFPVIIDSPVRKHKLYGEFVSRSRDNYGYDLSKENPDIGVLFSKGFNDE